MKNYSFKFGFILLITLIFAACSSVPGHRNSHHKPLIDQLIDPYLKDPALQIANVGIFVQDPETRQIIYQRNAHRLFMPASNQKLVTTSAALHFLGPDYHFITQIYTDGTIQNGVLNGDLYIKGGGDPTLSGRFHNDDMTADLRFWTDSLAARGITSMHGNIVADANMFDDNRLGSGWAYDDLSYWYAAEISALSFNDNCLDVLITPGDSVGAPATISYSPQTSYITMQNEIVTADSDSVAHYDYHREDGTNHMRFFGEVRLGHKPIKDYITIHDPALYTATVFSEVLGEKGIQWTGTITKVDYDSLVPDYAGMQRLVQYKSPPFSEIIKVINKHSQNFYAEQTFKTLGFEVAGDGSFRGGRQAVYQFLGDIGVETEHMSVMDGSGLSRRNLIAPFQLGTILRTMYSGNTRDVFLNSLPVGGGDGTLGSRFKGSIAQRRVLAKTGYVGFVRTLSGYVQTSDNHQLVFSIMVNHYVTNTSVINNFQDNVVSLLAAHSLDELLNSSREP